MSAKKKIVIMLTAATYSVLTLVCSVPVAAEVHSKRFSEEVVDAYDMVMAALEAEGAAAEEAYEQPPAEPPVEETYSEEPAPEYPEEYDAGWTEPDYSGYDDSDYTYEYSGEDLPYYVVVFDPCGVDYYIDTLVVQEGTQIGYFELSDVQGYRFCGWYADPGYTVPWNFDSQITCDTTIYAKWEPTGEDPYGYVEQATYDDLTLQRQSIQQSRIAQESAGQHEGTSSYVAPTNTDAAKYQLVAKRSDDSKDDKDGIAATSSVHAGQIPSVKYRVYTTREGWQKYVKDGNLSTPRDKEDTIEGISIKLDSLPVEGGIRYRVYIEGKGWQEYAANNAMAGTRRLGVGVDAIQIRLTGEMNKEYDVWYKVCSQNAGWSGWAKNNAMCGSVGYDDQLESVRVRLAPKGSAQPGSSDNAFHNKQWEEALRQE